MPNISQSEYLKLKSDSERLKDLLEARSIEPFVKEFLEGLGVYLAATPLEKWPHTCKELLKHVGRNAPTAYQLYLRRLPQPRPVTTETE